MFGPGLFGDPFDFDGDGKLDAFEQTAEFMAFEKLVNSDDEDDFDDDSESDDLDDDIF